MVTPLTFDRIREHLRSLEPARITDPGAGQAAVALVLTPTVDDLEALFIRRAQHAGDPWSGHMALPGGRRDPEDADLFHTSVREAAEETGVQLRPGDLLGELPDFTPRTPVLPQIVIRPFVFGLPARPAVKTSAEVAYYRWVPLTLLKDSATTASVDIRGVATDVSAFVLGDDIVWGLTERIIKPFIDLVS